MERNRTELKAIEKTVRGRKTNGTLFDTYAAIFTPKRRRFPFNKRAASLFLFVIFFIRWIFCICLTVTPREEEFKRNAPVLLRLLLRELSSILHS